MRRISANYIFPIISKPLKNGILELDDDGNILNVIDTKGNLTESARLEFYNGIIIPGIVPENEILQFIFSFQNNNPRQTLFDLFCTEIMIKMEKDDLINNYNFFKVGVESKVFLISGIDFQRMKLAKDSNVKRLV